MYKLETDKTNKYHWNEGQKPTAFNAFDKNKDQTVVCINNYELKFGDVDTMLFNFISPDFIEVGDLMKNNN